MFATRRPWVALVGRLGRLGAAVAMLDLVIVAALAAHLAGGIVAGAAPTLASDGDPFGLLGTKLVEKSCPEVPLAVGKGTFVVCPAWTAVLSPTRVVEVVSVYGPGNSVVDAYPGDLPKGLAWGEPLKTTWKHAGKPNRITSAYGTPTLVYFVSGQPYRSIELRFNAAERLTRINASIVR